MKLGGYLRSFDCALVVYTPFASLKVTREGMVETSGAFSVGGVSLESFRFCFDLLRALEVASLPEVRSPKSDGRWKMARSSSAIICTIPSRCTMPLAEGILATSTPGTGGR